MGCGILHKSRECRVNVINAMLPNGLLIWEPWWEPSYLGQGLKAEVILKPSAGARSLENIALDKEVWSG